jgi:hypothetical protein
MLMDASMVQERLQRLRGEVEQLEQQLGQLDAQQNREQENKGRREGPLALSDSASTPTTVEARKEVEERLRALWAQGAQLQQENNRLRLQFVAMSGVAARLGELVCEDHKPYISVASELLFLRPLTPPECLTIHRRSMEVVRSFISTAVLSAPLLSQFAGWRERREVDRGLFRYAMQKRFTRSGSSAMLATKSFLLLTEPAQLRRFYSDALNVDVRVVQKVDRDNCVLFQQMRAMDATNEQAVTKSLLLVSRFRIANGFRIHIYGLEEDQLPVADRHRRDVHAPSTPEIPGAAMSGGSETAPAVVEVWNSQFCWMQFEDVAGDSKSETTCLVTYAGITPTVGANARFWMSEVLLHCLRWEHLLLGSWVSLPPSE